MKKALVIFGVVSFCLSVSGLSFAETIGNPADIHLPIGKGVYSSQMGDFITINAGFDADFLLDKKFKSADPTSSDIKMEGAYYMGRLSCTLADRIQPYIKFGMSDLEMEWKDGSNLVKLSCGTSPTWGLGLKAYIWEVPHTGVKLFSTGSVLTTKPHKIDTFTAGGTNGNVTGKKIEILERQATIGVSKQISIPGFDNVIITPYGGAVWSETTARVRITQGTNIMNSGADGQEDNLGVFLGADFMFMDNLSLNLEGRFIDQDAISIGFTALF